MICRRPFLLVYVLQWWKNIWKMFFGRLYRYYVMSLRTKNAWKLTSNLLTSLSNNIVNLLKAFWKPLRAPESPWETLREPKCSLRDLERPESLWETLRVLWGPLRAPENPLELRRALFKHLRALWKPLRAWEVLRDLKSPWETLRFLWEPLMLQRDPESQWDTLKVLLGPLKTH